MSEGGPKVRAENITSQEALDQYVNPGHVLFLTTPPKQRLAENIGLDGGAEHARGIQELRGCFAKPVFSSYGTSNVPSQRPLEYK